MTRFLATSATTNLTPTFHNFIHEWNAVIYGACEYKPQMDANLIVGGLIGRASTTDAPDLETHRSVFLTEVERLTRSLTIEDAYKRID